MTWTWALACDIITLLSSLIWYLMEDQALQLLIYKKKNLPTVPKDRQCNSWDLPKFRQKRKKHLIVWCLIVQSYVLLSTRQSNLPLMISVRSAWWISPGFIFLKVYRSFYPKPNIQIPLCGYWQEVTPESGCSISSLSSGWNLDKLNYIWVILRTEWHDNITSNLFFFFSSRQPWN